MKRKKKALEDVNEQEEKREKISRGCEEEEKTPEDMNEVEEPL